MTQFRANNGKGKDGMLRRFSVEAMGLICALVPDFQNNEEATRFLKRFTKLKRVQNHIENRGIAVEYIPSSVQISNTSWRCTSQARTLQGVMTLPLSRGNRMEVMHILAHYLQPEDTPWHGGEFGAIFLDLIERDQGADMKRQAKDIMIELRLKTFVKSNAARERQSAAYYNKITGQVPQGLVDLLNDLRKADLLDA